MQRTLRLFFFRVDVPLAVNGRVYIQQFSVAKVGRLSAQQTARVRVGRYWLVTFNTSKTKRITFNHYRAEPEFSPVVMNGCTVCLIESTTVPFGRLLRLKFL